MNNKSDYGSDCVMLNKQVEWKYLMDMVNKMGIINEDIIPKKEKITWEKVAEFQFNSEKQQVRIVFKNKNDDDYDGAITELDFNNPVACGIDLISAFTKDILK